MTKTQSFLSFGLAVSTLLVSSPVLAGGFAVARFGGERGHAASDHVTSIFYNPAGLALGDGIRIYVEGTLAYRSVDYTRDPGAVDNDPNAGTETPADALDANAGKNTLRNVIASPFAGVAVSLPAGLAVGLGFYVPYGGQAKWDQVGRFEGNQQYPGALDGAQRWASIEGSQRGVYGTLALAWRSPGGRVAVGAGISAVQNSLSLTRARNFDGTDGLVDRNTGQVSEGRSLLEVDNVTPAASIGVMAHVTPCFRVGVSYQSQPNFGGMTLEGTLTNRFGATAPSEDEVELEQELPDQLRVAAEWNAFHRGSLRFGVEYVRWSVFENQCLLDASADGKCALLPDGSQDVANGGVGVLVNLPRDWKDNFGVHVGGSYFPTDQLELNAGLTYDTNAVPDETLETALIDANKAIGTVGGTYQLGRVSLEGTLGGVYYVERDTEPNASRPLQRPGRNPDMAGTYEQLVVYGMLGVGLTL